MSKQVHLWRASGSPSTSATRYISPINGQYFSATEHQGTCIVTADGEFSNWSITLPSDPAGAASLVFTLRVNGVDTAASITINSGSTSGTWTGTPISLSEDDEISIRCVPSGTPVVSTPIMSWDFDGVTAGACIYGMGNVNGPVALTRTNRLLNSSDVTNWTSASRSPCGINCTITRYTVKLDVDPGGGTWEYRINKNGVAQDGTGGTPDTRMTFSPGTTKQSKTFSLSVTAGDHLSMTATDGGGATHQPIFGVRLISSVPGICHFGGLTDQNFDTTNTQYHRVGSGSDLAGSTEGNRQATVGLTGFTLSNMHVVINDIPGSGGDAYLFSLRKNGADGGNSVNIENSATSGSNASSTSFATGDTIALEVNPAVTPTTRNGGWAWGMQADISGDVIQRVTQLVVEVATDEDEDADPPEVVTECTGGGTVASGTNPAAGVSLDDTVAPIVWMELTLNDGSPATTYRWAKAGVNIGEPKQARVLEFGTVTRALTDPDGGPESATISTLLADFDGTVRALWVAGTLRHAAVDYYIADLETLRSGGTPWRVFRGFVAECQPEGDRRFRLISEDVLTARLNSVDAQDLQTPRVLVDESLADLDVNMPMFGKAVPDIYGSLSAEDGAWECYYVGRAIADDAPELGALDWFLVGAGVLGIQEVYVGGLGLTPVDRIQLPESVFVDSGPWWVPGKDNWIETNQWSIRDGRRYTLIAGRPGASSVRLAREGTIPLVVNVCGYDTVGDRLTSPVTTINGPARALLHWLNNRVAQDATGNWLDIAEHGDFSLFDTTTFEAVQALFDAGSPNMTCDGAVGGDYDQASWRDRVAEFCRSFAYDFGINRHGQGILVKLDRSSGGGSPAPRAFTPAEILASSVRVDLRASACENEIRYVYGRNYVTTLPFLTPQSNSRLPKDPYSGDWLSGLQTIQDTTSITALGGGTTGLRRSQVQEYRLVRDQTTADATAQERLDLFSPPNGRCEGTFDLTLKHGFDVELGDLVDVEHWDLPWTGSRTCQVRRHETDLDELMVSVGFRDVDDLLA